MKNFLILFTLLISSFAVNAQATVNDLVGTYERNLVKTSTDIIIYTLILNADGTFLFHSYDKIELGYT